MATISLPTAVNAENHWLIMRSTPSTLIKIPTNNLEECEAFGAKYKKAKLTKYPSYVCIKGNDLYVWHSNYLWCG